MPKPDRDRIKTLLDEALAHPATERVAFLEQATGDDTELRNEVMALLLALGKHEDLMAAPTGGTLLSSSTELTETAGTMVGRYKLLQEIGEGGFGVVWMAEQQEPVVRRVALKVIKLGMDTRQVIARFEAERQALALMDHPNIAKVLDGGATESGRPYFVMELVKGVPITEYCDKVRLSTKERLELFMEVCHAIQHAHQKGIIHRDIKPSNVLVMLQDGVPVPKVIDFGVAKATERRLTEKTLFTEFQQLIGTPEYMSPEQAEMSGLDIDTRTDIYSLGVLLYELLTGALPFDPRVLREHGYLEMLRVIREEEPPKPSTKISTLGDGLQEVASRRQAQPGQLSRIVHGDLDWIVMQSLEKDRSRRYETARDFAQDVRRHLEYEPVEAGPPGATYRVRKFIRRHRVGVMVATVLSVVLVGSTIAVAVSAMFATEQAALAAERLQEFNTLGLFVELEAQELKEWREPVPAREDRLGDLEQWVREVENVLAERDRLERLRDELEPLVADVSGSDWNDGWKARKALLEEIKIGLLRMDKMSSDVGMLTWAKRRIEWARQVASRTVEGDRAARWEVAIAEIRRDHGIDLPVQVGLVPLGKDPRSGLQEFACLLPGAKPPVRDAKGFAVGPTTCPVFVLLPGGEFDVGAQGQDENGPRFDPYLEALEKTSPPLPRKVLDPFFASKYEFTHGQWLLLTGINRALKHDHKDIPNARVGLNHPVMDVDYNEVVRLLTGWCFRLPTVEEWEYFARGGKDSVWWCGDKPESLKHMCNVADAGLAKVAGTEGQPVPWDDKYVQTAPVHAFPANGFGMHGVIGNVAEVVVANRPDGSRAIDICGGSWHQGWRESRVSSRFHWRGGAPTPSIGFRPALSIEKSK